MFWVVGDKPSDHGSVFTKTLAMFKVVPGVSLEIFSAIAKFNRRFVDHGVINDHERIGVHADTNVGLTAIMVVQTVFVSSIVNELKMLDVCHVVHEYFLLMNVERALSPAYKPTTKHTVVIAIVMCLRICIFLFLVVVVDVVELVAGGVRLLGGLAFLALEPDGECNAKPHSSVKPTHTVDNCSHVCFPLFGPFYLKGV